MANHFPTDAVAGKARRNRRLSFAVLLGCAVGWYFGGDAIREVIDREMVRHVRCDAGAADLRPGRRPGNRFMLVLPKGEWVRAGPDVVCYGRALGHHTVFGFRAGYAYVRVNGKVYGNAHGPCGSSQIIPLGMDPLDRDAVVTEAVVVQALENANYRLIP